MAHYTSALFEFLRDLAESNNRDWFNANKARFEADAIAPSLAFITDIGPKLHAISPHFLAIPKKQGGSMFRIYRDTRFSKDKTPYKTNIALQFRHENASRDVHAPGFYLGIAPGDTGVGVGMWHPDPRALARIRDQVVAQSDAWADLRGALHGAGLGFMGESLKRPPKGYDKGHPHIEDLKRKDWAVQRSLEEDDVVADGFLDRVVDEFVKAAPMVRFLCESQDLPY